MTPFWERTEKHLVGCKKREKIEKVTGARDDKGKGGASMWIWWLVKRTAGPPTSLRSGRDDNSYLSTGSECPREIAIPLERPKAVRRSLAIIPSVARSIDGSTVP